MKTEVFCGICWIVVIVVLLENVAGIYIHNKFFLNHDFLLDSYAGPSRASLGPGVIHDHALQTPGK